ncbi:acetylglutamate kinase [Fuerstiella marisgermanici]|uniref:Acetylglutamate kinase n=1 Tax=Fuerstiella marisgermanici TaxID=1891926 RepID=A0A1P8WS93_9PLAN|nr:acetylglutamate kinase [Fuerstiella marisgermanici]APZ96925.1 Acetylglutamate kinase [Fuerstiella marisgermanici]
MQEAIRKASVLIEALSWIQRFKGRYVVVKLGGSTLDQPEAVDSLLTDIVFMASVGMRPVIVHGGGKAISSAMADAGIEPRFVEGRRFTDPETLRIASTVLVETISTKIVEVLRLKNATATGLHFQSENVLIGEKLKLQNAAGEAVDLGHVGRVVDIDKDLLVRICSTGTIPVIPSIALDREGHRLNVNADTAAAAVARELNVEKLVFLSDIPGILTDLNDPSSRLSHVTAGRVRQLIADEIIAGGMVPKVEAALDALDAGVRKVHIVDASMPHSVLLEIYSDVGVGTEIVP